jgi:peptide/nickel transport system substrate-binding protein
MSKKINRREFLFASATAVGGLALAACAPTATTEAPAPTEAPVSEAPTEIPTPTRAAAAVAPTATPIPTVATAKYHEAPDLAEKVQAGSLPPVEERLPANPLVLSPLNVIGKYGGRCRMQTSWLAGNLEEGMYGYSPVRWIDDGMGIAPGLLDTWSTNDDNSEWSLHMREGVKWSDGEPATMNDTMFWWNDLTIATDKNNPDGLPEWAHDANGDLVKITQLDDYTIKLTYGTPAPLTLKQLAMWVKGCIYSASRWITPAHYIKQFHPKYNTEMKDFQTLNENILFRQNPECPTLDPWMVVRYECPSRPVGTATPIITPLTPKATSCPTWTAGMKMKFSMLKLAWR